MIPAGHGAASLQLTSCPTVILPPRGRLLLRGKSALMIRITLFSTVPTGSETIRPRYEDPRVQPVASILILLSQATAPGLGLKSVQLMSDHGVSDFF